jgi:three-Cys-motif partner protein
MNQRRFGSSHTRRKLDVLEGYLNAYSTALKNIGKKLIYFDAFAGSGEVRPKQNDTETLNLIDFDSIESAEDLILGSSVRALNTIDPFHRYIFVDKLEKNIEHLKLRLKDHDRFSRCRFKPSDANESIKRFCEEADWSDKRAVMFLDPFGSQVNWETIECIAKTERIDLWYLFPAGLSVNRQISRTGAIDFHHEASINRIFGNNDWKAAIVKGVVEPDFFEERIRLEKVGGPAEITEIMIKQMQGVFGGGVLTKWLPLGRNNSHWYSLIFAISNRDPAAVKLAKRLAMDVMKA